jgi:hypothetical protein
VISLAEIKPIETLYNGYRFRSRLEARWAVFFDAAGIEYQYEPEGYVLSDGTYYLPDFYLPSMRLYVEIKPKSSDELEDSKQKLSSLFSMFCCEDNNKGVFVGLFIGDPYDYEIEVYCNYYDDEGGSEGWFSAEFRRNYTIWGDCLTTLYEYDSPCIAVGKRYDIREPHFQDSNLQESNTVIPFCFMEDIGKELLSERLKARQARFEHGECG